MGTWGTDIDENDFYMDLKRDFLDLYNEGVAVDKIYSEFLSDEDFDDVSEESHEFWFAITDLLWQCKGLNERILSVVKKIIESKANIKYWKETTDNKKDIIEREKILNQFLNKITIPKKRARKRIKKKLFESMFKKGDVLTFELVNGKYGIAIVIDDEKGMKTESGKNLIVLSEFESDTKPTLKDLKHANVGYMYDYYNEKPREIIGDFGTMSWHMFPEDQIDIDVIGNFKVQALHFSFNMAAFQWNALGSWSGKGKKLQIKKQLKLKDFIIKESLFEKIRNGYNKKYT